MRERYAIRTGLAHSLSAAALALMRAVETRSSFATEVRVASSIPLVGACVADNA